MNKNIIKSSIFIFIFCILLYCIINVLWLSPTSITYFYNEPKNSIDVAYFGSSNSYVHFNTVLAYNKYGFTTGLLSSNSQPFVLTKYLIKEAEKYQNPSLYIIDLTKSMDNVDKNSGESIRVTTDSMKFSKNRIDAINKVLSYKKDIKQSEYIDYYFAFLIYHNRWKEPSILKNIVSDQNLYKGYLFHNTTTKIEPQNKFEWKNEFKELDKENEEILRDLINYIKSDNLNVLFVVPFRYFDDETNAKMNSAIKILQENEFKVINFNTLEEFNNIDFSKDFYNKEHLNIYGATKYTLFFAKYLKENYDLNDHRNDKNYSSWDKEYERFKMNYKNKMNQDFEDLIQ